MKTKLPCLLILLLAVFNISLAQQKHQTITGSVLDEKGHPLPNANVVIQDLTNKTHYIGATDSLGIFTVQHAGLEHHYKFEVSYVGYQNGVYDGFIVKDGIENSLVIRLLTQHSDLDDIVVVGYGTQKKTNLSGAVQTVSGTVLNDRPLTNVSLGLQGIIPGLNINPSNGRADDAPSFNIRGWGSISSYGDPLILVDNVPLSAKEVTMLNPTDILTVTVLKDAGAAAIYGARAAFGVVLITTKSADSKKVKINFNGNNSYRTRGNGPDIITDPLTVMQYKHDAATPLYDLYTDEQRSYAKKIQEDPSLARTIIDPNDPTSWMYYGSTNWMDELYRKMSPAYNGNLSISQKTDRLSYYMSAGYYRQEGILKVNPDVLTRLNLRLNSSYQLTKWWKLGNNTAYTNTEYNYPTFMDDNLFWDVNKTPSLSVVHNPDGSYTSDGAYIVGAINDGGRTKNNTNDFLTTFNTELTIIPQSWTVSADASFRRTNLTNSNYSLPVSYHNGPDLPYEQSYLDGGSNSSAGNGETISRGNIYNIYTNFHESIGKHYFAAVAGFNQEYRYSNSFTVSRIGLISSALPTQQLATGTISQSQDIYDYALRGVFGRINYIYDGKYIIEFNGRKDGSSKFPSKDRWGVFPSGSVAWVLSKESFMKYFNKALSLDLFKVRASYGTLGNQNVWGYYPYIPSMSSSNISSILDGSQPLGVYAPGVVSNSLTWEKVKSINIGADLSFFSKKLNISYDWYTRYTDGMLTKSKTLPGIFGASEPVTNAANLKTQGWELSVTYSNSINIAESPLSFAARLSISDSKAFITKYDNPSGSLSDYYVGQQLGEIWGLTNDGFFNTQEEVNAIDQSAVGSDDQQYKFYVGDLKFKDLNGDKKIDFGDYTTTNHGDLKKIGNSQARLPYSLDLNTNWKNFSLRIFLQGVGKGNWYPTPSNMYFWGVYANPWTNVTKMNMNHWSESNPDGYFPRLKSYIAEDKSELGYPQTRYLQSISYLRLKNLTIGYSIPKKQLEKWQINGFKIYVSGENILTASPLKAGLDPEGVQGDIYPYQKTYSIGLNIDL